MDGPDDDRGRPGRSVPDPAGGPGRDAVLGVQDSELGRERAEPRSSSVGRLGGAAMMVYGAATGRKKPAAGSPSAITRTGYPAACSASASASVWTTPPRGLTE